MILIAASSLAACAKKSGNNLAGRGAGTAVGVAGNAPTCTNVQQSSGRVYENNATGSAYTFEQRVKGLIAATVDPQYFGTISGDPNEAQSGVTLEGRLRYDASGKVLLDQTNLKLTVYDSFVGQKDSSGTTIQPFPINFNAASAGTMNLATKQFTLQFKDSYGEVNLTGVVNGATVTGTISYQNYTNYNGSQGSGSILGAFTIATCGWIQ